MRADRQHPRLVACNGTIVAESSTRWFSTPWHANRPARCCPPLECRQPRPAAAATPSLVLALPLKPQVAAVRAHTREGLDQLSVLSIVQMRMHVVACGQHVLAVCRWAGGGARSCQALRTSWAAAPCSIHFLQHRLLRQSLQRPVRCAANVTRGPWHAPQTDGFEKNPPGMRHMTLIG